MKKALVFIALFCYLLIAANNKIEVTAKNFESVGNTTTITGSVHIIKDNDILDSDLVKIYTDKDRKPISYEAIGNVRFSLVTNDGRKLKGKSKRLIYDVAKNEYKLYDNAHIEEIGKANIVRGDLIILTNNGDYANVVGNNKKPARVTFLLNNEEDSKKKEEENKEKNKEEKSKNNTKGQAK